MLLCYRSLNRLVRSAVCASLVTDGLAAQGPTDAQVKHWTHAVVNGDRYRISVPCDQDPNAKLLFDVDSIVARGSFNREGRYWPFRVVTRGRFICQAFGSETGASFRYQVVVRLSTDDFGTWSAQGSTVETSTTGRLSPEASVPALAHPPERTALARNYVDPKGHFAVAPYGDDIEVAVCRGFPAEMSRYRAASEAWLAKQNLPAGLRIWPIRRGVCDSTTAERVPPTPSKRVEAGGKVRYLEVGESSGPFTYNLLHRLFHNGVPFTGATFTHDEMIILEAESGELATALPNDDMATRVFVLNVKTHRATAGATGVPTLRQLFTAPNGAAIALAAAYEGVSEVHVATLSNPMLRKVAFSYIRGADSLVKSEELVFHGVDSLRWTGPASFALPASVHCNYYLENRKTCTSDGVVRHLLLTYDIATGQANATRVVSALTAQVSAVLGGRWGISWRGSRSAELRVVAIGDSVDAVMVLRNGDGSEVTEPLEVSWDGGELFTLSSKHPAWTKRASGWKALLNSTGEQPWSPAEYRVSARPGASTLSLDRRSPPDAHTVWKLQRLSQP